MQNTIGSTLDHAKEIKVTLGDDTHIVHPLTLTDLYTHFEGKIRSEALADAKEVAQSLPKEDRVEFMTKIWKQLPKGAEVDEKVSQMLQSLGGIQECIFKALLTAGVSITFETLIKFVNMDTLDKFLDVFYNLIGYEDEDVETEGKPSGKK